MTRYVTTLIITLVLLGMPTGLIAQVEVSNVTSSQRDDDSGPYESRGKDSKDIEEVEEPICSFGNIDGVRRGEAVTFSPNGSVLYTASDEPAFRAWNTETGQLIRTFSAPDRIRSIAVSPNGNLIATGDDRLPYDVRLWDANTGNQIRSLKGHSIFVNGVAFSPDGMTLASSGSDRRVFLWNVNTGAEIRRLNHDGQVRGLDFSADGTHLLTAEGDVGINRSYDGVRLWNVNSGSEVRKFIGHEEYVKTVQFSPDGTHFLSGSFDGTSRLWNIDTGAEVRLYRPRTGSRVMVNSAISPDGTRIFMGRGREAYLLNLETGTTLKKYSASFSTVNSVAYHPDGGMAVTGGTFDDDFARLWDTGGPVSSIPPPTITITTPAENTIVINETTSIHFSGTAQAFNSTIDSVQWRNNSSEWQTASGTTSWSFTVSPLAVGTNLIEVRSTNAEGAHSPIASRTITREAAPPVTPTPTMTPTVTPTPTPSPLPQPDLEPRSLEILEVLLGIRSGTIALDENNDGVLDAADLYRSMMDEADIPTHTPTPSPTASPTPTPTPAPPTISITTPASNETLPNATTSFAFSGTASAPGSSISAVQWRHDGGGWETASGTTDWSFTAGGLQVGINLIEVRATNTQGTHSALASRTITREAGGITPGEEITINLPGGVPLVMVRIPAGSFVMGSPASEQGRWGNEGPQTNVTISRAFYMGKYEVTQAQWQAVMGNNPSSFSGRPNNPVETVSWNDIQSFITALNAHISSSGQGPATMRLPTEAEWEYAARAGTSTRFSFGNSLIDSGWEDPSSEGDWCEDDGIRSQYMWYCGNANGQTHPVGQKLPNAFGLYDMHGNVSEWCQDWFGTYPGGSVTDPTGPSSGSGRVPRGGGWGSSARYCRSANRSINSPSLRHSSRGFRLASVR